MTLGWKGVGVHSDALMQALFALLLCLLQLAVLHQYYTATVIVRVDRLGKVTTYDLIGSTWTVQFDLVTEKYK